MAQIERQKLLSKSLILFGHSVIVINRAGSHDKKQANIYQKGIYENIEYVYSSGTPYKEKSIFKRVLYKVSGYLGELKFIFNLSRSCKIEAAIVTTMTFSSIFYYWFISKIFGFKIILDYVELNSAIITPEKEKMGLDYQLFDKYGAKYSDNIICISDFLLDFVKQQNPKARLIKIPAICDYNKITTFNSEENKTNYFLYCGSAAYLEVIEFILDSFAINNHYDFNLFLVVSGAPNRMVKLSNIIKKHPKANLIKVFSKIPYEQLLHMYKNARALLIPLRPTLQDIARFPHKIGEYTASGRPIITTDNKELRNYFVDTENALIAESYDISEYSRKMQFIIDNPEKADKIGEAGKKTCKTSFDFNVYGEKILNLIKN